MLETLYKEALDRKIILKKGLIPITFDKGLDKILKRLAKKRQKL